VNNPDMSGRLAEIRARHNPGAALTLAQLIADARTTHPHVDGPVIVQGCVVTPAQALKDTLHGVWFRDLPALLSFAEQALALADRLAEAAARLRTHGDGQRTDVVLERTERSADLQHAADVIRAALAAALAGTVKGDGHA
jgi:hypothetical protein